MGGGGGFALLNLSHFSLRSNYFIFTGYLKTDGGKGGGGFRRTPEPPLDLPLSLAVQNEHM